MMCYWFVTCYTRLHSEALGRAFSEPCGPCGPHGIYGHHKGWQISRLPIMRTSAQCTLSLICLTSRPSWCSCGPAHAAVVAWSSHDLAPLATSHAAALPLSGQNPPLSQSSSHWAGLLHAVCTLWSRRRVLTSVSPAGSSLAMLA